MKITKPKSHTPTIHDNTEEDLILVPPSVLENTLDSFEAYVRIHGGVVANIGLALALFISVVTSDFKDIFGLSGQSIQGAFVAGLIIMVVIIIKDAVKLVKLPVKSRTEIVKTLLKAKIIQQDELLISKKQNANTKNK